MSAQETYASLETVQWPALFNRLWPGPSQIREKDEITAFTVSVADRVSHLREGEIARALQTISERQRSKDETVWKGTPTPSAVVSQIIKLRYQSQRPPEEQTTNRENRLRSFYPALRAAEDHHARWDIICNAGDMLTGGTISDCITLHGWVCQQWSDFPVDVQACRRVFESGKSVVESIHRPAMRAVAMPGAQEMGEEF